QSRMLSGGMKRRLMVARALITEPKLLILDEPTAGVDIEIRRSMWEFLREINAKGTTIILTTHYLEEAENLCRHVAMINHGKIVQQGSMSEFLNTLNVETFILYLQSPLDKMPVMDDFPLRQVDPQTLEVDVRVDQQLNDLFYQLSTKNININSLKNKTNRLEELFVNLTEQGDNHEQ
ncbi:MAG: ABC transporter ATP-binding protein, partial [Gammaproteobacteria bacterium]|nr:ABC transporter ATP-binding protein [Gammaproteobacteria bacterium]